MDNKPTISLGAKVFIYTFSVFFDFLIILISLSLSLLGVLTSVFGIGLAIPVATVALNKLIIIVAAVIFMAIYQTAGVGVDSKLLRSILKGAIKKFIWPWIVKMIPFLGFLPMITLSNLLLLRVIARHDKKKAKKAKEEKLGGRLQENAGYA